MTKITHETIAECLLAQSERFARQGFITANYRNRHGRKFGPYFRLAYRDLQNRQRSIYLGRSEDMARRIQSLLKAQLQCRRQANHIRTLVLASLRLQKKDLNMNLRTHGFFHEGLFCTWLAQHESFV
jgi:hypothetical protein